MSELYVLAEKPKKGFEKVDMWLIETDKLSPLAKMIYIYICSRPKGWQIYASEIASRWDMSIEKVSRGLKELKDQGVLEHKRKRDPLTKRIEGMIWNLIGLGSIKTAHQAKASHDRENRIMEKPSHGKSGSTQIHCSQKHESHIQQTESAAVSHEKIDQEVVDMLTAHGVGIAQAEKLASEHPVSLIKRQVAWMPHRTARNKAGYLVKAITENYSAPANMELQTASDDGFRQRARAFIERIVPGVTEIMNPETGVVGKVLALPIAGYSRIPDLEVEIAGQKARLTIARAMELKLV